MKESDQRIALADFCGLLTRPDYEVVEYRRWEPPDHVFQRVKFKGGVVRPCYIEDIPDYPNDLNAMHRAELKLGGAKDEEHSQLSSYYENLCLVVGDGQEPLNVYDIDLVRATAAQKAEALLKTINQWTGP